MSISLSHISCIRTYLPTKTSGCLTPRSQFPTWSIKPLALCWFRKRDHHWDLPWFCCIFLVQRICKSITFFGWKNWWLQLRPEGGTFPCVFRCATCESPFLAEKLCKFNSWLKIKIASGSYLQVKLCLSNETIQETSDLDDFGCDQLHRAWLVNLPPP